MNESNVKEVSMLEVISFYCALGGCISSSLETPVFSKTLYPGESRRLESLPVHSASNVVDK